ncbi:MAG: hypothetical protein CMI26_05730 [Opitutae bacterium]|nr:hypothetical protein [Opitutae bacterium]
MTGRSLAAQNIKTEKQRPKCSPNRSNLPRIATIQAQLYRQKRYELSRGQEDITSEAIVMHNPSLRGEEGEKLFNGLDAEVAASNPFVPTIFKNFQSMETSS